MDDLRVGNKGTHLEIHSTSNEIMICIDGDGCYLTTGKEYKVIKKCEYFVRVKNDRGMDYDYSIRQFKLKGE